MQTQRPSSYSVSLLISWPLRRNPPSTIPSQRYILTRTPNLPATAPSAEFSPSRFIWTTRSHQSSRPRPLRWVVVPLSQDRHSLVRVPCLPLDHPQHTPGPLAPINTRMAIQATQPDSSPATPATPLPPFPPTEKSAPSLEASPNQSAPASPPITSPDHPPSVPHPPSNPLFRSSPYPVHHLCTPLPLHDLPNAATPTPT
jgi:hypothetical protein